MDLTFLFLLFNALRVPFNSEIYIRAWAYSYEILPVSVRNLKLFLGKTPRPAFTVIHGLRLLEIIPLSRSVHIYHNVFNLKCNNTDMV